MAFLRRFFIACILLLLFSQSAFAQNSFVVRKIQVQGLVRIRQSTVLNYLSIHVGQHFHLNQADKIIEELYQTGFFSRVSLFRRGNTLIVRVKERPIIALVQVHGNKAIKTKKLKKALGQLGIVIGRPYYSEKLNEIKQGLQFEYDQLGRHDAKIDTEVLTEPNNRVAIIIRIHEGPIAKVRKINIIGNHAFSKREILRRFTLTTPGLFTLFTHHDRYSKLQLQKDLQNLQIFYLDHGYIRFHIVSYKATMTPNKKGVIITIVISEGALYKVSGYQVTGKFANRPKVQKAVSIIKIGHPFSRHQIIAIDKSISDYFEDLGYAFPNINVIPKINDQNHTVFLIFNIKLGKRVYVRKINFSGNNRTEGDVLRTQLHQMEASLFSLHRINESKRKLANLPYLKNIQVTPVPVPGHPNEVDLNYKVHEVNAGRASVQAGWSDLEGILYGASLTEPNFMGSGRYVSLAFSHSQLSQQYQFAYNNPFYTVSGVSRGFNIYYNKTTATKKFNIDTYTMNDLGGSVFYGIPINDFNTIHLGYGYDYISISNVNGLNKPNPASPVVLQFLQENKSPFSQFNLSAGWTHSSLDRAIFPTKGALQTIDLTVGVPIIQRSVGYYKAIYSAKWYLPIGHGFILSPHANFGYGGGIGHNEFLPFYNNFYAGGITTLPGFEPNSLGPKNPNNSDAAIGGNVEILGGINLILPEFLTDRLRTAVFVDFGNIFETNQVFYPQNLVNSGQIKQISYESVRLKNLRVSTGLMVSYYLPFLGLVDVSIATPIVKKKGDRTAVVGFTFGTTL